MPKSDAFIAHGGGPTAVLNASLLGVVEEGRRHFRRLWAACGGLPGLLKGQVVDLLAVPRSRIGRIADQPGSMIGSFRGAISNDHIAQILEIFSRDSVRHFFYTGGNGSMGTALRIARAAAAEECNLTTIGIPKTVDNDICRTDHCPGFGSAARFVATAVREIGLDQRALPTPVSIIEVMGRNAGWLAASAVLARQHKDDAPHLICVPEHPFKVGEFLGAVDRALEKRGWFVGVVAEGLRDPAGRMLGAARGANLDAKGRPLMGGTAAGLAVVVSARLRVRARSEKPGILGRALRLCRSSVDAREAYETGRFAVQAALSGESERMVALRRRQGKSYDMSLELVSLSKASASESCRRVFALGRAR